MGGINSPPDRNVEDQSRHEPNVRWFASSETPPNGHRASSLRERCRRLPGGTSIGARNPASLLPVGPVALVGVHGEHHAGHAQHRDRRCGRSGFARVARLISAMTSGDSTFTSWSFPPPHTATYPARDNCSMRAFVNRQAMLGGIPRGKAFHQIAAASAVLQHSFINLQVRERRIDLSRLPSIRDLDAPDVR